MEHKTTARLLAATEQLWAAYSDHPFVRGIADGTLDVEKFRYYMLQDYVYLLDYARVFALGTAKAGDPEAMGLFAAYVHQILDGEMDIHRAYLQRLGISPAEAEAVRPALDNRSYTAYMLRVAYEDGPGEILAAILSCALSYEVIARRMVEQNPAAADHPFYGQWVQGYAAADYHDANQVLVNLTERLTAEYTEAQLRHLEEIFTVCSRYEMAFWDMAWELRS